MLRKDLIGLRTGLRTGSWIGVGGGEGLAPNLSSWVAASGMRIRSFCMMQALAMFDDGVRLLTTGLESRVWDPWTALCPSQLSFLVRLLFLELAVSGHWI
jgi:hypothetical protein